MQTEKIADVVKRYRKELEDEGVVAKRMDVGKKLLELSTEDILAHALHLCENVETYLNEERMGKANRHFAWIQALLWMDGRYTIADFMDHNRP